MQGDQLWLDLAEGVREAIREAGASRREVAAHVGVSIEAVENWCSGRTRVSPHHMARLLEFLVSCSEVVSDATLAGLLTNQLRSQGFGDEVMARAGSGLVALRKRNGYVIFITSDLGNHHQGNLGHLLQNLFLHEGISVLMLDYHSDSEALKTQVQRALDLNPLALVVIAPANAETSAYISSVIDQRDVPCVFLFGGPDELPASQASVLWDEAAVMDRGADVIWESGCRKIVSVYFDQDYPTQMGLNGAFPLTDGEGSPDETGAAVQRKVFSQSMQGALHQIVDYLDRGDVDGLVVRSTFLLPLICGALDDRNLSYPNDVSLIGFAWGSWIEGLVRPPVTYFELPLLQTAKAVQQAVSRLIRNRRLEQSERVKVLSVHFFPLRRLVGGSVRGTQGVKA